MRRPAVFLLCAIALARVAAPARSDVDTEVPLPAKLQGSLAEGEVETVRFFAPAGSLLQVKLGTKKKSGLDPDLRVLDPDGAELPVPAANLTDKGASIKVKKLPLPRSGIWALVMSGAGAGDYKLVVKAKVPTSVVQDVQLGDGPVDVTVPVQFGATLKVKVSAAKGSSAAPVVQSLGGMDLTTAGKRTATSHSLSVGAGASGDLLLRVDDDASPGGARVSVKIKPPKSGTASVDIRAATLGRPSGGETAVGKVIDPALGGAVSVGPGSDLAGAGVVIPAGALTAPTLISLRSAAPEVLPDPEGDTNAGPTVEFGPSGLQFQQSVDVTIPIDAQSLPVQATEDDITVLVVEADGSSHEVTPSSVDLDAGTCTVPTSGFSRFTAVAPAGSPQLAGRSYWGVSVGFGMEDDFGGRDESGVRYAGSTRVRIDFGADGTSWTAGVDSRAVVFGLLRGQSEQLEGLFELQGEQFQDSGTWEYGSGGRRVRLLSQRAEGENRVFVSRDGTVLLDAIHEEEGTPTDVELGLFVERPRVTDPSALLLGTYRIGELGLSVEQSGGPGSPVDTFLSRTAGRLTFRANGTLDYDLAGVEAFGTAGPSPSRYAVESHGDKGTVTWSVDGSGDYAGTVLVDTGDGEVLRIFPHRDGRMFVMTDASGQSSGLSVMVGVKVSSGRSSAEVTRQLAVGTCFLETSEYQIEDGAPGSGQILFVPDYGLYAESARLMPDGAGTATFVTHSNLEVQRDPQVQGGVRREQTTPGDDVLSYDLRKDGELRIFDDEGEVRGAVTGDGSFGFLIASGSQPSFGLVLFVDRPPEQPQ